MAKNEKRSAGPLPRFLADMVDVDRIEASPYQSRALPRDWGAAPADREFIESVREHGILHAVGLRPHPARKGHFQLAYGERRLRAVRFLGLGQIPALIAELTDGQMALRGAIENLMRTELSPLEAARAVAEALAVCRGDAKAVAVALGQTPRWVAFRANLHANLSEKWRTAVAAGGDHADAPLSHLALIARHPKDVQDAMLEGEFEYRDLAGCGAADLERALDRYTRILRKAPFGLDGALAGKPACGSCQDRSDVQPGLFDDPDDDEAIRRNARCLRPACWAAKKAAALKAKFNDVKARDGRAVVVADPGGGAIEARELFGNAALSSWDVAKAKKGDKGAVPALVFGDDGGGEVQYVVPAKFRGDTAAKVARADTTPGAKLAAARERLALKRWRSLVADARGRFEGAAYADVGDDATRDALVAAFAVAYGVTRAVWRDEAGGPAREAFQGFPVSWGATAMPPAVERMARSGQAFEALWLAVRRHVFTEINLERPGKDKEAFLEGTARLVNVDFAALKAAAETAHPPPGSIARYEAEAKAAGKGAKKAGGPDRKKLAAGDDSAHDGEGDDEAGGEGAA